MSIFWTIIFIVALQCEEQNKHMKVDGYFFPFPSFLLIILSLPITFACINQNIHSSLFLFTIQSRRNANVLLCLSYSIVLSYGKVLYAPSDPISYLIHQFLWRKFSLWNLTQTHQHCTRATTRQRRFFLITCVSFYTHTYTHTHTRTHTHTHTYRNVLLFDVNYFWIDKIFLVSFPNIPMCQSMTDFHMTWFISDIAKISVSSTYENGKDLVDECWVFTART